MADGQDMVVYYEIAIGVFVVLLVAMVIRVWWVLGRRRRDVRKRENPAKTLIVAGSGGHTTEILRLMSGLSNMYTPRIYVVADSDKMSEKKIDLLEMGRRSEQLLGGSKNETTCGKTYEILKIPRSREVQQSWISSLVTTLNAIKVCLPLVFKCRPDLVIVNGPGTCIPVCMAAILMKIIGIQDVTVVYVESICRVETLSLSGQILYYLADQFFVQWQKLQDRYPKAIYLGKLV